MRDETFLERHPVVLTETEVDERAREAAGVALKIEEKKRELELAVEKAKDDKKRLEAEEKALSSRLFELGRIVKTKRESREVPCMEVLHGAMVETVRSDTGEVVGSRSATKTELEDRQETLFPGGGARRSKPEDEAPKH